MNFFFGEACWLGSVKLFFTEPCSRRDHFVFSPFFFLSSFAMPFLFRTVRIVSLVRFQTYTQHHSLFEFSKCHEYTVLNVYSSFSRASLRNKSSSRYSVALCLFFVTEFVRLSAGSARVGALLDREWEEDDSNGVTHQKLLFGEVADAQSANF